MASLSIAELSSHVIEIYRPATLTEWQRRVGLKLRCWQARSDAELYWSGGAEVRAVFITSVRLPGRDRAPRLIGFMAPISDSERRFATVLAVHISNVVDQMEHHSGSIFAPNSWRDTLSSRKLEFALAAAQGMNNAEIAHRLNVAPRTVARQLQEVYGRLGKRRSDLRLEWRFLAHRPRSA